ncbi:hypothetical protein HZA99_02690, partial [Candidatus Woesearchaeota archaeon]|nr:hypothetical protein [Candidatus Woesearchaeota archaeon]
NYAVVTFYPGFGFYNGIVLKSELQSSGNIEVHFERRDGDTRYDRIFLPRNALTRVKDKKKIAETLEAMSKYEIQI